MMLIMTYGLSQSTSDDWEKNKEKAGERTRKGFELLIMRYICHVQPSFRVLEFGHGSGMRVDSRSRG
jgi:hypothetical protein